MRLLRLFVTNRRDSCLQGDFVFFVVTSSNITDEMTAQTMVRSIIYLYSVLHTVYQELAVEHTGLPIRSHNKGPVNRMYL